MQNGGHICGYLLKKEQQDAVLDALSTLCGDAEKPMLFAVGDGNHSLASAKAHWENIRENLSDEEKLSHPARYALAEIVNLYDESLQFEPIHRVVFDVDAEKIGICAFQKRKKHTRAPF